MSSSLVTMPMGRMARMEDAPQALRRALRTLSANVAALPVRVGEPRFASLARAVAALRDAQTPADRHALRRVERMLVAELFTALARADARER